MFKYQMLITGSVFSVLYLSGIVGAWRLYRKQGVKTRIGNLLISLIWPVSILIFWLGYLAGEIFTATTELVRYIKLEGRITAKTAGQEVKAAGKSAEDEIFKKVVEMLRQEISSRIDVAKGEIVSEIKSEVGKRINSLQEELPGEDKPERKKDELLDEAVSETETEEVKELVEDSPVLRGEN
jgi:TM2 domain-containing membrane protein YozV